VAEAVARVTADDRREAGVALARNLADVSAVAEAGTLMAFLSLPTEIDTWPVIRWAWERGKRVAIPRIEPGADAEQGPPDRRSMAAVLLEEADVPEASGHPAVRPGPLGILDAPDAPIVPPGEIDVVLLPCQAVDRRGNRLGKGGGFYDRFLAQPDLRAARIAIGFREQVLDEVPVAGHDQPIDMVVTDNEVLVFER
jgi:5-formyltetrahydrofolate cyclo-ligase